MYSREQEIAMMSSPDRWPHSFWLPLKVLGEFRYGILVQNSMQVPCPPPRPEVRVGVIGRDKVQDMPVEQYESIGAIYDAGWRVD